MSGHDVERAFVAAVCDGQADRLDRARERAQAELDALLEEWSSNAADQMAASEARIRAIQEDNLIWLRNRAADDGTQDVAGGGHGAPGASGFAAAPVGHDHRQQPTPGPDDDIERARAIKDMDMATYARSRAELGVRDATSMSHLSGN